MPDGFSQGDVIWGADGRRLHTVNRISQKERDAFASTGTEFDGYAAAQAEQMRESDIESAAKEALRGLDPDFKQKLSELGYEID
jgi:hypothetical protein